MELKQIQGILIRRPPVSFNRTILELKRNNETEYEQYAAAFNRTILELKRSSGGSDYRVAKTFNRTILELKQNGRVLYKIHYVF